MKRAWAFSFAVALSAALAGCGKGGSQDATQNAGASASQAPVQLGPVASGVSAASGAQQHGAPATIPKAQLPGEAAETLRLVQSGGPFPFGEDGVLFRNSASLLPQHARGYYHAYTVRTPGAADRGLRRIVCGGARKQIRDCYYTDDYYASFKRIGD
ncbi:ribonuclease [Caballeronia sp. LZ043]|uniref:ribonuclease n=1 Tax=Caballeronia sp. LZ043 TaxID=3038569 RepID=UPI00285FD401|nr:ribonuclease [Caballeronia sp. LZ043]MDR5820249.1 ribonuclease [Caballeronia sp. LZ043]